MTIDTNTNSMIDERLAEFGADFTVSTEPAQWRGEDSESYFWTVRHDLADESGEVMTSKPLAVVGKDFVPIQNATAFDFANDLVERGDLSIESIKILRDGRKVLLTTRLPEDIEIAGEPIARYLSFVNGHDGHTIWGALFTPERLFCTNQLIFPSSYLPGQPVRSVKIKHTARADERRHKAVEAMQRSVVYADAIRSVGEMLAAKRSNAKGFERFLKELIPVPEEEGRKRTNALSRQEDIRAIWRSSENLEDIRFTRWGFLQAVVEWNDHYRPYKSEDTRIEAIFRGSPMYSAALDILSEN